MGESPGDLKMNDIIHDTEQAFKDMKRLWDETLREEFPNRLPISYQRFKVLRAVNGGTRQAPDIAWETGLDRSSTADLLHCLRIDKLVTRDPIDNRAYGWDITPRGKEYVLEMNNVLMKISDNLRMIAKEKLESWI
jgi:DNA-binding MarR family transcriptional regulator